MSKAAKANLGERVLSLAEKSMLNRGAAQLSLRQIATELGVTPMAIYRHFASNEDLQLRILDVGFNRFGAYLSRSEMGTSPLEQLKLMAEGFIDFAIENPGYFELMFLSSQVPSGLRNRDIVLAASQPTYDVLLEATRRCIVAGDLPDANLHHVARDLLSFCIGQAALYISGIMNWSAEEAKLQSRKAFSRQIQCLMTAGQQDGDN